MKRRKGRRNNILNMEKLNNRAKIFLIILFIILTIIVFDESIKLPHNLPFNQYNFFINNGLKEIVIGDLELYYNFDNQSGNLNFQARHIDSPQTIIIYLPDELNITDWTIKSNPFKDSVTEHFIPKNSGLNSISFTFDKPTITADFKIEFKPVNVSIFPSGRFILNVQAKNIYNKEKQIIAGNKGYILESRFWFDLGKFKCNQQCISELTPINSTYTFLGDSILVISTENDVTHSRFILNTFNKNEEFSKRVLEGLGISFIIVTIELAFPFLGRFIEQLFSSSKIIKTKKSQKTKPRK